MKQYDLIALDLDGTVLGPDGKVSPATKRAVRRVLNCGYRVAFATGRNYYESLPVLDAIGHYDAAIFVGGASVIDLAAGGESLHRQTMQSALAVEVCRAFAALGLPPMVLQDRAAAGVDFLIGPLAVPAVVRGWYERTNAVVREVADLEAADHAHTLRVSTLGPPPLVEAAEAMLAAEFAERTMFNKVKLAEVGVELLEVFDPSVNKWAGLLHVAARHDIPRERIVAVGDDMNDLHMIREAGLGVAMGNARPRIKALADRVIGSHAEDGLAAFLDELCDAAEARLS